MILIAHGEEQQPGGTNEEMGNAKHSNFFLPKGPKSTGHTLMKKKIVAKNAEHIWRPGPSIFGDLQASIFGDLQASISGDLRASISGDLRASISGDQTASISGDQTASISGDQTASISGNQQASTSAAKFRAYLASTT
ncbi:hypothetical protein CALCODRAFT_513579 [Calocera cornea HHB12733]|uniref:Uncharacterized protein n=1 Tax=Calocera cornea HHB12733 TaxID=1353952 RepID=A0A165AMJ9_9BASI|nr:hypothetical protein CALCODRAFT_513579 [Calocera cornea HHB12733]